MKTFSVWNSISVKTLFWKVILSLVQISHILVLTVRHQKHQDVESFATYILSQSFLRFS